MSLPGTPTMQGAGERPEQPGFIHGFVRPPTRTALPPRQTSFIGRTLESAELLQLLANPDCRMVTLIGPGGIGKTRLALEVAEVASTTFADGIAFVPLQAVSANDSIASAIANAVGFPLTGRETEREQVARVLRPLHLLLVLDNFDRLIGEAPWLAELLASAPRLCALVTSREALNVREEWRYPLAGLATPGDDGSDPSESEAVRLFVERARQVRHDFSLELEREGVVRLCRITDGLPLALELAAVWIKILSSADIADEIERNIAFLATNLHNVPARHRSMHATFDYSWALLSDEERDVFRRLAVFRGGFQREAARRIAGASLLDLSSLVDKSLLRTGPEGRFLLHELLRQYAEEQLRAEPEVATRTYEAHRDYFLGFLATQRDPIVAGGQRDAVAAIAIEWDNVRSAWHAAATEGDVARLNRVSHPLTVFGDISSRHRETLGMLEEGLAVMRAAPPSPLVDRAIAAVLVDMARLSHRLGDLPTTRAAIEESEVLYAHLAEEPPPGQLTDPQAFRSLLSLIDGDYAAAERHGAEVIQRHEATGELGSAHLVWWVLAASALWQEDTAAAAEHARRCTEAALAAGDRWYLAYGRNVQGHVATARGDYVAARQHYAAGYAIGEEFNDPVGIGTALAHLGKVAILQENWQEAEQLFRRSLAMARDIGDRLTVANAYNGLSLVRCATGDYAGAGLELADGLRQMAGSGFLRLLLTLLASSGDWLLQTGRPCEAIETLSLVQEHAAADHETRTRVKSLLRNAMKATTREEYNAAVARGQNADPVSAADLLIPILTAPVPADLAQPSDVTAPDGVRPESPDAAATSGLSPRQVEVLRLVARGMTDAEIANALFISPRTVSGHLQSIYNKLGISSRTAATAFAYEQGLV